MRVLLRSIRTGNYFGGIQEWTSDSTEALDFMQIANAINTACDKRLEDVEVVLSLDNPQYEVRLPIQ